MTLILGIVAVGTATTLTLSKMYTSVYRKKLAQGTPQIEEKYGVTITMEKIVGEHNYLIMDDLKVVVSGPMKKHTLIR